MWQALNPFRRVTLEPVVPAKDIQPAQGRETLDPVYRQLMEGAQLRSLAARTKISMIHESLAERALGQMKG